MATGSQPDLLPHLHRALLWHAGGALSDGQLLEDFLAHRAEAAFALLVQRHGPMVLGVCRRLLGHEQDAEDAFQATFLVLVRKGGSIVPRENVGNWLYGVACRTALKAKSQAAQRMTRERQTARSEAVEDVLPADLRELLDRELQRLPEKYRTPIVLCDLEGRSQQDAAEQLGWPAGTLTGRLSRARALLARRLARHGVALSVGALAAVSVPSALASSTVQAAVSLAAGHALGGLVSLRVVTLFQGVLHTMLLNRIKNAALVLVTVLGLMGAGAGVWVYDAVAQKPDKPKVDPLPSGQVEVRGVIESVDAAAKTVTLSGKGGAGGTYTIGAEAKIHLDDGSGERSAFKEGKLADLSAGLPVTLRLIQDKKTVVGVWAEGPTLHGTVKAVDADKKTITVLNPARKGEADMEQTFAVPVTAKLSFPDTPKGQAETRGLANVPTGAVVTLKLTPDRKTVVSLHAEGATLKGTVKAVDATTNTITLVVQEGKEPGERMIHLSKSAVITLAGSDKKTPATEIKLKDVSPGALATVRLSLDQKEAVSVIISGPTFRGVLKSADAQRGTVTVAVVVSKGEPEQTSTYTAGKDTRITVDGREVKLADVPVEATVVLQLAPDAKALQSITAEGPAFGGTVKAVDAGKLTITISLGKQGEKSFTIAKDAIVTTGKSAKTLKLTDVAVDKDVVLQLTADQKEVRHIMVHE
jgi:RNA polymerase sigma factor (sigma-70 family)